MLKKRRKLVAIVVGAMSVLVVVAVSSALAATGAKPQNLRIIIGAEPPSLDPGLATDTTSSNVLLNIYEPLVRLGPSPELKALPAAATSWTVKGTTVTLNLRKNLKWTNGQARDRRRTYVWSWLRTISPELAADYAYQLFGIKGAAEYNAWGATTAKAGLQCAEEHRSALKSREQVRRSRCS